MIGFLASTPQSWLHSLSNLKPQKELQKICTASSKARDFSNNERKYFFEISFFSYSWAQWIILYNLKILAWAWRPVIVPIQPGIVKPILKIILSAPLCTIDSSNHYMSIQYLHALILTSLQRIPIHGSIMQTLTSGTTVKLLFLQCQKVSNFSKLNSYCFREKMIFRRKLLFERDKLNFRMDFCV